MVDIIREYFPLKKKGQNYIGSCPFNSSTELGFVVCQDTQTFECSVCGDSGDRKRFIEKWSMQFLEGVME